MGLVDWLARQLEMDAAHDEQAARARRVGAEAARTGGFAAGATAWMRESTGATRNGRMRLPRVECSTCHTSHVQRADGHPAAHRRNGQPCSGGGPAT
ncbi:hypothetical protein BBK14_33690 [Parafrankia soli]|uniref:Uncharacterized protein n=1 Tax=Parafrankia soli TaxID=2599596 RepID=A0A1S1QIE5_9ACTN|nr:hypothetical protein [Parafrankia soli]OHV33191.1 hypothetical protein BBK14_33690 [Parafrankia soli]